MVNVKIADLTAAANVQAADIFEVTKDPAGTPLTRKATAAQIATYIDAAGAAASAISTHEAAGDPHPAYALESSLENVVIPNAIASDNWIVLQAMDILALGAPTTVGANRIYASPFRVFRRTILTDLGARVQTAVASSNFQLAIYAASDANGLPSGSALASTGNLSGATAGIVTAALASALTLDPGIYWACCNSDSAVGFQSIEGSTAMLRAIGSAAATDLLGGTAISTNGLDSGSTTFGTWPDLTAQSWSLVGSNSKRFPAVLGQIQ